MSDQSDAGKAVAGSWLTKDSAIILALATALLYFANNVYGSAYLHTFGIRQGFQGFGLENLAMLNILDLLIMVMVAWLAHLSMTAKRSTAIWAGLGFGIIFVNYGMWAALFARGWWTSVDAIGGLSEAAVVWIAMSHARELRTDALKRNESYEGDERSRRDRRVRSFVLVASAWIASIGVLSELAEVRAIHMADHQADNAINRKDSERRLPVYWVGDRYVFITNSGTVCAVHVMIDGNEQALSRCPEIIADVTEPNVSALVPAVVQ